MSSSNIKKNSDETGAEALYKVNLTTIDYN